jgi:hypothetical protein
LGWFSFGGSLALSNLSASGTYTVVLDPYSESTGSVRLRLVLATDAQGATSIDGSPLAVTLLAGQNGNYTFSGTAGQRIGLAYSNLQNSNNELLDFTIVAPNGATIYTGSTYYGTLQSPPSLPATGTYKLRISRATPSGTTQLSFWMSTDITGTLVAGGSGVTFSSSRPGQNARYTFNASAGQNLVLTSSDNTFTSYGSQGSATVYAPNGTSLGWFSFGGSLALSNLSASGTYTVVLDPYSESTGSLRLSL